MSIDKLKQLREQTGISMMECKKALDESDGDIEKAKDVLREKGKEMVKGREGRKTNSGIVTSYIHANGKIGVLLELFSETDFVAKSEAFQELSHEICLQIAASHPLVVKDDDIKEEFLEKEKKICQKQLEEEKKPKEIMDKIIEGKLRKYKKEVSLLSQLWVKDSSKTIKDLIEEVKAKTGENIEVGKFTRYEI